MSLISSSQFLTMFFPSLLSDLPELCRASLPVRFHRALSMCLRNLLDQDINLEIATSVLVALTYLTCFIK